MTGGRRELCQPGPRHHRANSQQAAGQRTSITRAAYTGHRGPSLEATDLHRMLIVGACTIDDKGAAGRRSRGGDALNT